MNYQARSSPISGTRQIGTNNVDDIGGSLRPDWFRSWQLRARLSSNNRSECIRLWKNGDSPPNAPRRRALMRCYRPPETGVGRSGLKQVRQPPRCIDQSNGRVPWRLTPDTTGHGTYPLIQMCRTQHFTICCCLLINVLLIPADWCSSRL